MSNHFHLVPETPQANLVAGMKSELAQEAAEGRAERLIIAGLESLKWRQGDLVTWPKGGKREAKFALEIRRETTMTLLWLANRLCMGSAGYLQFLFHQTGKNRPRYSHKPS